MLFVLFFFDFSFNFITIFHINKSFQFKCKFNQTMSVFNNLNKLDSKRLSLPPISGISIMKLNENKLKSNNNNNSNSKRFNSDSFTTNIITKKQLNKRDLIAHHKLLVKLETVNVNSNTKKNSSESSPNLNTLESSIDIKSSMIHLPQTSPPLVSTNSHSNNNNNLQRNRRSNSDFNFKKYLSSSGLFKTSYDIKVIDDKVFQSDDFSANYNINKDDDYSQTIFTTRGNTSKNTKFDPKLSFKLLKSFTTGHFGQTNLIKQLNQLYAFKKISFLIQWNRKEIINNLNSSNILMNNNFSANKEYLKLKLIERNRLKCLVKEFKLHTLKCLNLYSLNDMILATDLKSIYVVTDYLNNSEHINLKSKLDSQNSNSYLPEYLIKKWFNETISAIDYLHSNNILHANLKLTNFLLDSNESIKLCDFGYFNLFKTIMVAHVNYEINYLKLLIQDSSSSRYLPPETFESFKYDFSSEIYSIGAIFFELIFLEKYDWMMMSNSGLMSHFDRPINDLTFLQIIFSMLHYDPLMRPKSSSLKQFCEWHASIEFVELLKNGKFSISYLTQSNGKKQIHKQININSQINYELLNCLLSFQQPQNQHKNLLFIDKYICIETSKLFTLTDYMPNGTLQQRIEHQTMVNSSKFKENLIIQWLMQILNGLSYLHDELNLVHGNLKCQNILFTQMNTIKLTDFGFYHLLSDGYFTNFNESNMPPELKSSNSNEVFTTKSDIFMFGVVLFKLITLKEFDSYEFNSIKMFNNSMKSEQEEIEQQSSPQIKIKSKFKLNESINMKLNILDYNGAGDYSFKIKKSIVDMLDSKPSNRPDLNELEQDWKKYDMFNYQAKFAHTKPTIQIINGKVFNYIYRNNDSLGDLILVSVLDDDYIATSSLCSSSSKKKFNNRYKTDWYFVDSSQDILETSQLALQIPSRFACQIENNYLCCFDQEKLYFLDENLQLYKQILLIDLLESTKNVNSVNYRPSIQAKPIVNSNNYSNNNAKSNLLVDLRLKIKSIYYDLKSKKLYLLISIQAQQSFLNIFDLEFVEKSSPNKTTKLKLNIYLNKSFHIAINPRGSKSLSTNKYFIIVCEKDSTGGCKLFSRVNCRHLFSLNYSSSNFLSPILASKLNKLSLATSNENSVENKFNFNSYSFTTSSTQNDFYNNYSNSLLNENINYLRRNRKKLTKSENDEKSSIINEFVQDVCVDSNENIYVAYSYTIDSFNEKGKLKILNKR